MSFSLEPRGPFSLAEPVRLALTDDGGEAVALVARAGAGGGGPVEVEWTSALPEEAVRRHAARVLSLDVDGSGVGEVADPVARDLLAGGWRPVCFGTPFEAAVWAVLTQRSSMAQAAKVKDALAAQLGSAFEVGGEAVHAFPGPAVMAELGEFPGLWPSKVERIHRLAAAALDGELDPERLRALELDVALEHLQTLPGIGPFAATLVLARGAGHPDVPPPTLRRFRQAVTAAYGRAGEVSDEEVAALSEGWRPFRGWVVYLMRSGVGG